MPADVRGYLESKGITLKQAGPENVHTGCWWCSEPEGKRGRLYINVAPEADPPGLFQCFLCGERGAYNKIRKHFGDSPLVESQEDESSYVRHEIWREAAAYYHDLLADREDVYRWLRYERGLEIETIQKHQIGWADGTLKPFLLEKGFRLSDIQSTGLVDQNGRDFLYSHVTIPYHTAGNVTLIRGKDMTGKYLTPSKQKGRLFNSDVTWNAERLVITEGEFDALVLEQLGYAAVGVPGAAAWQPGWTDYCAETKRVFICFDNDTAGIAGAEKVARMVGPKSRIIRMPETEPGQPKNDPSEWIAKQGHTKDDFEMLLIRSRGGHLLSVDDAFTEWEEVKRLSGLRFGFEKLDAKLSPGLLPAQVMIVLAKTGTGKTLLTLNIFHRMALANPEAKILFVSLEQTRGEWFERARRIHRFYNLNDTHADCLDFFRPRLLMVDKNRVTEEELVNCIEQFEFELGQKPDLVAIDYLGYWSRSYKGDPYERTGTAVMALKAIAKEHRIAMLAPHQVNRMSKFGEELEADAGRESGLVEETADFLLLLWANDSLKGKREEEKTGELSLKLGKSRHGGAGTIQHLQFAPLSLAMIPHGDPLYQQAKNEHHMNVRGDTWEKAIYRHRTGDMSITGD